MSPPRNHNKIVRLINEYITHQKDVSSIFLFIFFSFSILSSVSFFCSIMLSNLLAKHKAYKKEKRANKYMIVG